MKKMMLIAALAGLFLASCKDDETPDALSVSSSTVTYASGAAGEKTFTVSSNVSWKITVPANDWCTVSPLSGQAGDATITLTATENFTDAERKLDLVVTAGSLSETVKVTQPFVQKALAVSRTEIKFPTGMVGTETFTITSNINWSIDVPTNDFCKVEPATGKGNATVTVTTLTDNFTDADRTVKVTVSAGSLSESIDITQPFVEKTLAVTPDSIGFADGKKGTSTFAITSNTNWTIAPTPGAGDWYSISQQSGNGNATITVEAIADNPKADAFREVSLTVAAGLLTKTVKLHQEAALPYIILSADTISYSDGWGVALKDTVSIDVESNTTWKVLDISANTNRVITNEGNKTSWIVTGDKILKFTPIGSSPNLTGLPRYVTGRVVRWLEKDGVEDASLQKKFVIAQPAVPLILTADKTEVSFSDASKDATTTVNITSNVEWSVTKTSSWPGWLDISLLKGVNSPSGAVVKEVTFTAKEANTTGVERSFNVKFILNISGTTLDPVYVKVTQPAQ